MSAWRRRAVVLAVGVLLAGLASCGIGAEDRSNEIEPGDVPFGLLDEQPTTTVASSGTTEVIHLVAAERLVAVERTLPAGADVADLLGLVVDGPTGVEEELGITTAVPAGTVASVRQSRGEAVVDLTAEFGDLRTADQPLALAQIVYTLTGQPGIGSVRFTLEGQAVDVPLPDGTSAEAVTRDDLEELAPG